MYSIGWFSGPGTLPDSMEDGYESAEEAWDSIASYLRGDEYLWEYAECMVGRTWDGVQSLDSNGLAYVEVWRTEE